MKLRWSDDSAAAGDVLTGDARHRADAAKHERPLHRAARGQHRYRLIFQPSHAVEVDDAHDAFQRRGPRVLRVVARAQQSRFLGAERHEHEVALGGRSGGEVARQLDQHRHAAGVVVGAGMDLADVRLPGVGPAASEVVVMGGDQDGLVGVRRVGAGQVADDVVYLVRLPVFALLDAEALEIAAVVAGGCEAGAGEFAGDVGGRFFELRGAEPAAFHFGGGEVVHVLFQAFSGEDRGEFGERFAGGFWRGGDRAGGALFGAAQVRPQRRIVVGPFAAGDVGRLVAFESEVGIPAVMGQLAGDSGECGGGIDDDPADRLVDVFGVPANRHGRMAGGGDCVVLELEAGVADRQSQRGVGLEQGIGEPVVAAQDPGGGVGRQFIDVGVEDDRHVLRGASPAFNECAIRFAGRFVGGCRQDGHELAVAEHLADRRCGFARVQQPEQVELRVHFQQLRLGGGLERERRGFLRDAQQLGLESIGGGEGQRRLQCEFRAGLDLAQHAGHLETAVRGLDLDRVETQVGRAGEFHPLFEEVLEVPAGNLFQLRPDIAEAGLAAAVLAVEARQRRFERLVAELPAQHVKSHQRLAVTDGFGGGAVPGAELGERKIAAVANEIAVFLQRVAPVLRGLARLLLHQVVRHVGRQSFAPVAAGVIDEHRIAPPVVQNLVGIGGRQDEREANDHRSQQRERRHAVTGLPEVLDECELAVGVGADQ